MSISTDFLTAQITATYQQYGGRVPTGWEIGVWLPLLNGGASIDSVRQAIVDDTLGRNYLPTVINQTYQQYAGRSANGGEIAFWMSSLRNGVTTDAVRQTIVDDTLGRTYLTSAISQIYQQYGGRSASSGEIAFWMGSLRGGATVDAMRRTVVDDALGQSYLPTVINQTYQAYGGRAATNGETSYWLGALRSGATADTVLRAIANDPLGQAYLPTAIGIQYQTFGGRAPTADEVAIWASQIQHNGATLDTVRATVINDILGQTYLPTAIDQVYQAWAGRTAQASEVTYWMGAFRAGAATIATVRTAVVDSAMGQNYLPPVIAQQYASWGGRAPTNAETAYWMGAMRDQGATAASLKMAILSGGLGAGYASAQLTAYYSAHSLGSPSDAEVQSLLVLLRGGASYVDAEATVAAAHVPATPPPPSSPYDSAIYEAYGAYIGRAPTAAELDQWGHSLTSTSTAAAVLHASLIATADGQAHLVAQITTAYQQFGGRAPTGGELATWQAAIQNGGSTPDSIRVAILSSALGQSHASDAIAGEYQEYLGRATTNGELQTALATLAVNQDYTTIHQALFTTPDAIVHFYDQLATLYGTLEGRAYTSAEQGQWFNQIYFSNATYATMRTTLMLDPSGTTAQIVGTAAADTITIHGVTGETTISNFNAAVDRVMLDTAVYGGLNLLDAAHAREVMSTDGITPNVLITFDANDHILLHGVNLAELSASNFLFG